MANGFTQGIDEARAMGNSVLHQLADHSQKLDDISNHLSNLNRGNKVHHQWRRFEIPENAGVINGGFEIPAKPVGVELMTIPAGATYQIVQWAFLSQTTTTMVALMVNDFHNVIDAINNGGANAYNGSSSPRELILPANAKLIAANQEKESAVFVSILFKITE